MNEDQIIEAIGRALKPYIKNTGAPALAAWDAAKAALAEAGIVCVPREPTPEMIAAGRELLPGEFPEDYYAAMIAAAPDQR